MFKHFRELSSHLYWEDDYKCIYCEDHIYGEDQWDQFTHLIVKTW